MSSRIVRKEFCSDDYRLNEYPESSIGRNRLLARVMAFLDTIAADAIVNICEYQVTRAREQYEFVVAVWYRVAD